MANFNPLMFTKKQKIVIIAALVAVGVVTIIFFVWIISLRQSSGEVSKTNVPAETVVAKKVCSRAIIREASGPLDNLDQLALAPIAEKIKTEKDFDKDPNCLYIVLQYALGQSNASLSQDYYNKLEKVYNPAAGFSNAFTTATVSLKTMKTSIDVLQANAKAQQSNMPKISADQATQADKKYQENK